MAERIINEWVHNPGRHCASTAISDLMNFYGYDFSESECFGIGEGIGFWYIEGMDPKRIMHFRSIDLEEQFFKNIGIDFKWNNSKNSDEIKQLLIDSINKEIPVLLRTDIFYLDYYKSKTHFPGHTVLLWGYDPDNNTAYVTDTGYGGQIQVPFNSLLEAVMHGSFMNGDQSHFASITKPISIPDKKKLSRAAAYNNAKRMLDNNDFAGYGVKGISMASQKLFEWEELEDWKWLSRFAYQVIEKRGTGGGGFRKMYSEFIQGFARKGLVKLMDDIASRWSELAHVFKSISESSEPDFTMASDMLYIQAIREEEFYSHLTTV